MPKTLSFLFALITASVTALCAQKDTVQLNGLPVHGYFFREEPKPLKMLGCHMPSHDVSLFSDNEYVYATEQGTVVAVIDIPGSGTIIMMRMSNEQFAVYGNLDTAFVKKEETIHAGQPLGKLLRDDNDKNYLLYFELWKVKARRPTACTYGEIEHYLSDLQHPGE